MYDKTSEQSILDFAFHLTGKTLRDFLTVEQQAQVSEDRKNKGLLGNLVEKYYFGINPGSSPLPDFPIAGVELKTAAVVPSTGRLRKGPLPPVASAYQSKERLKLSTINYMKIVEEEWDNNHLFKKCAHILLLLSLFDGSKSILDRKFIAEPISWRLSGKDVEFIMNDWLTIVNKIKDGKAHELSGADTYYLEACTSGTGTLKEQPFSSELAKERSFAFKPSFVDVSFLRNSKFVDSVLDSSSSPGQFEEVVLSRLRRFRSLSVIDIAASLNTKLSSAKHYLALLSYKMLEIKSNRVEEFAKAGISIKTVNLLPNGTPSEDMSFPAFSYMDIVSEDWEDSTFKLKIDTKTLLVVFQTDSSGQVSFVNAYFWNMPKEDIREAKRVWDETRMRVSEGRANELPLKAFSSVAHVRNHGRNSKPENHIDSPKNGKLPVKGFWLNAKYIQKQIEELSNA